MIYARNVAQGFQFFTKARTFDQSPYNADGSLTVQQYGGIHIIEEDSGFAIYPDPNWFGSAPANEIWAQLFHGSSGSQFGGCVYDQAGDLTVRLYDHDRTNSIFITLTSTNDALPVITFGANGQTQGQKVFLGLANDKLSGTNPYCEFGLRAPLEFAVGVANDIGYVNYRQNIGWTFPVTLPPTWKAGRLIGHVSTSGSFSAYSARMRTAAENWGPPGYKASGLSVHQVSSDRRAADGSIPLLSGNTFHLNYGGVSFQDRADAALAAIPFGYHGDAVDNNFAAVGKNNASVELVALESIAVQNEMPQITSGQTSATFTTEGYTPQDGFAQFAFTGTKNAPLLVDNAPTGFYYFGPRGAPEQFQLQALQAYENYYNDPSLGVFTTAARYDYSLAYRLYLTTQYSGTNDLQPTFAEQQAADLTSAGASAARIDGRTLAAAHRGFLLSSFGARIGLIREGTKTLVLTKKKWDITEPVYDGTTYQRWLMYWQAPEGEGVEESTEYDFSLAAFGERALNIQDLLAGQPLDFPIGNDDRLQITFT